MLAGLDSFNATFLSDLSATENRLSRANRELSSGLRINQASDDPAAVSAIVAFQGQVDQITQIQRNLSQVTTVGNVADSALATASNVLDELTSIAAQGATVTATATSRAVLAERVQALAQQLVGLANTSVSGRYVFGGDDPNTAPYTYNSTVPGGVIRNNTAPSTVAIQNSDGASIVPIQTAQQIFDAETASGAAAPGNIFQNVYALAQALQNNDQAGVASVTDALKASTISLGQSTTAHGNTLKWLQDSSDTAAAKLTNIRTQISTLRDADVAQAATELTIDQTAEQAALAAHGSLNLKNLFSYLG